MSKMRSSDKSKSKSRTNSRRPISVNMKKRCDRKVRTKPMKKKFNVPVREQNKLQVNGIKLTLEERMEPYFSGLNEDIHVPEVDDSDDDFTILDVATQNLPIPQEHEARDEFDAIGVKIAKDCQSHVLQNQPSTKSSSLGGSTSYQDEVFLEDNSKSKKQKTNSNIEDIAGEILNESNYSQDVYGLDDDLVFTKEDFKIMDESAEKNHVVVNNVVAEAISPIPIDFEEDIPQEIPLKRLHKPSACLYIKSFDSASNDAQEDPNMIF
ncbi:Uncharacterized protein Fot_37589 [Forsythia ovata]|uniref:Uncharacterized protein n=1 Tax=Forsythia ovata TaxID=205694 RepID=A0ABD1RZI4_9LAMI